ncbi:hypothetical protein CR513_41432, partial [Mucuna pruriens]
MEFCDTLVQFNIFEFMKHPTEYHSLFGIDIIDKLVVEHLESKFGSVEFLDFVDDIDVISCLGSVTDESDYDKLWEVQDLSDSEDDIIDFVHWDLNSEFVGLIDQVCKYDEKPECSKHAKVQVAEIVRRLQLRPTINISLLHSPRIELKPLSDHLKYAYLDNDQQFPIIIANNLHQEQEEKLLLVLRQHKKAIRLNPTILDVVKKEVTKLLAAEIIYPISDSQWVSPIQVVPKKSGMTVMKNQHDELVPMRTQNSWQVYIDYRKLNQVTCKDHFPLPFIDQVLKN